MSAPQQYFQKYESNYGEQHPENTRACQKWIFGENSGPIQDSWGNFHLGDSMWALQDQVCTSDLKIELQVYNEQELYEAGPFSANNSPGSIWHTAIEAYPLQHFE